MLEISKNRKSSAESDFAIVWLIKSQHYGDILVLHTNYVYLGVLYLPWFYTGTNTSTKTVEIFGWAYRIEATGPTIISRASVKRRRSSETPHPGRV
jgi:hypothetical protein